jgi:hypothetical protein
MRVAIALTAVASILVPAASQAGGTATGVHGVVLKAVPICRSDGACEVRAAGVVLRFSRRGHRIAEVTTSSAGGYSVRLRPGVYAVSAPQMRAGTGIRPKTVRVPRARVARVDFHLDMGLQ